MSALLPVFPSLPVPQPQISPLSLSSDLEGYVLSFPLTSEIAGEVEEFALGPVGSGEGVKGVRLTRDKVWWLMPHTDLDLPSNADTQLLILRLAPSSPHPFAAVLPLTTPSYMGTLRSSSSKGVVARFERDFGSGGDGKVVVCLGPGVREVVRGVGDGMREARGWGGGVVEGLEEGVRRMMGGGGEEEQIFSGTLTYCTWNSLQPLPKTATSVLRTLSSLLESHIRPTTLLIDDAWQPTNGLRAAIFDMAREEGWQPENEGESGNGQRLTGFEMSESFLDGCGSLKELVREVRDEYGVKRVGVWHTTSGYWEGVEPRSFYPKYRLVKVTLSDYPGPWQPHGYTYYVPHPASASAFFSDYYAYLSREGIEFVKCDNVASLDGVESAREVTWKGGAGKGEEVLGEKVDVSAVRLALRKAVKESAEKYFGSAEGGRVIWCMAMSPRIILGKEVGGSTGGRMIIRNSDDYFPDRPDSHRYHIFANALNGMFNAQMNLIPDLDMFQSHEYIPNSTDPSTIQRVASDPPSAQAAYHASLRALSSGPVTVTDVAGHTDPRVLAPLLGRATTTSPSLALQAPKTFWVGEDVFEGVLDEGVGKGLKVWSEGRFGGGLVGVWNVRSGEGEVRDTLGWEDVRPLTSASAERTVYAVSAFQSRGVWVADAGATGGGTLEPGGRAEVELEPFGFEIFTVAPFLAPDAGGVSVACLGLVDKYNPLAGLESPPTLVPALSASGTAVSAVFKCVGVAGFAVRRSTGAGRAGEGTVKAIVKVDGKEKEVGVRRTWGGEAERVEVDLGVLLREGSGEGEEIAYQVILEVL